MFAEFDEEKVTSPEVAVVQPSEIENEEEILQSVNRIRSSFPGAMSAAQVQEFQQVAQHKDERYTPSLQCLRPLFNKLMQCRDQIPQLSSGSMRQQSSNAIEDQVNAELRQIKENRPAQFGVEEPLNNMITYSSGRNVTFYSRDSYEPPSVNDMALVKAPRGSNPPFWVCKIIDDDSSNNNEILVQWYDNDSQNIHGVYTARKQSLQSTKNKRPVITAYTQRIPLESLICWAFEFNTKTKKLPAVAIRYALTFLGQTEKSSGKKK